MKNQSLKYHSIDKRSVMQTTVTTTIPAVDMFEERIKSPATRKTYKQSIRQFEHDTGFKLSEKRTNAEKLEKVLTGYIIKLKHENKSYGRLSVIVSALRKYCKVYKIKEIDFDDIKELMPEHIISVEDRAYSKAEIRAMLTWANLRVKTIILLFASTGARAGALPELKLKNLNKQSDGRYKITLYAVARGKSVRTFTTLECARAIDTYLKERVRYGETLTPESPLIRKEFSPEDANTTKIRIKKRKLKNGGVQKFKVDPKTVSRNTIARLVEQAALRAGIRGHSGGKRQELMLCHAFRKHFNTSLKRARVDNDVRKMFMGHDLKLDTNYMRLTEEEILAEYLKAESELTISEEPALRQEVEKLKIANSDIGLLKATVTKQAEDLALVQRILEKYARGEIKPMPPMSEDELRVKTEEHEREMSRTN